MTEDYYDDEMSVRASVRCQHLQTLRLHCYEIRFYWEAEF